MSTFRKELAEVLKVYADQLYVINIIQFFDKNGEAPTKYSDFMKAAYKLYQMVNDNKSIQEIDAYTEELKKMPISYSDARDLFY